LQGIYREGLNIDASLFKDFTGSSHTEILIKGINTSSNRLPEVRFIGSLYQQDLPIRFMDDN
jgi:hypothetical protein